MEVILKQDVKNLGSKDEIVKVKPGFGRNFLIPKGFAVMADESSKKSHAELVKQRAYKEGKIKKAAQDIAELLKNIVVKIGAKVGESGKIFGAVNTLQLAEAIKKLGYEVERKDILIDEEAIKTIGAYTAKVKLHRDVNVTVNFEVVAE